MQMHVDSAGFEAGVTIEELPPMARFSLRVGAASRAALGDALGAALPERVGARQRVEGCEALCLGPDEWLILTPGDQAAGIVAACSDAYDAAPHSLTEISDRELSVRIAGPEALSLLAIGCPRDLRRVPVGGGARTIFDTVSVVLWRDGEHDFRLDVWRSFAPHVLGLLEIGRRELAVGL